MLSSGSFAAACLQAIAKGGSSILGRPGQTRAMFQASTTRRPVHTLTTVENCCSSFHYGLHGVVGMMFMHMRSILLYVICLVSYMYMSVICCYMLYVCYMSVICLVLGSSCYMYISVICCYMLYVCDMLYACYMSSVC